MTVEDVLLACHCLSDMLCSCEVEDVVAPKCIVAGCSTKAPPFLE